MFRIVSEPPVTLYSPRPAVGRLRESLIDIDPSWERHRSVTATPRHFEGQRYTGTLYDSDGALIRSAHRTGDRLAFQPVDPDDLSQCDVETPEIYSGLSVYLGSLHGGFGHFLLETLSRMWALRSPTLARARIVFHPWNGFDRRLLDLRYGYVFDSLSLLGIQREQVHIIESACRFEDIVIPEPLFRINYGGSPAFAKWAAQFAVIAASRHVQTAFHRRVYMSRMALTGRKRRISNEDAAAAVFSKAGFSTISPEKMPFFAQIGLIASAEAIAGPYGSALHLAMFSPPETPVISLDFGPAVNQYGIERACNLSGHHLDVVEAAGDGLVINERAFGEIVDAALASIK